MQKKTIKKFNEVPFFTEGQLERQLEKQVRFLKAVYPFLEDTESWNEGAIELRPIKRCPSLRGDYLRSFNTWHLQEKDMDALRKFLENINGKGVCLYYSTFAFDREKEVLKADEKPYQKGKINNDNALFTCVLVMDFDDITEEEFKKEKQKLTSLGIETIDIFSGHGFQSIILLDKKVYDKDILKKFTELMISKGFKIDEAIKDSARVMRMPYSFNCKALDKNSKHYDEQILATTDVNWTEKRYNLIDIFNKINSLEDVIKQEEALTEEDIKAIHVAPITVKDKKKEEKQIQEVKKIKIENLQKVYDMLDFERLPEPVQKMLQGTQDGLRNKVMMFIIPFLRNTLGLNIQTIKQVMAIWGQRCTPSLDRDFVIKEVDRIYSYGLKAKYGAYTEELTKAYGYINFGKYIKENKVLIANSIFKDFDVISDGAVKIYLALKLAEVIYEVKEFTKKDIQNYANIGERTVERNTKDLVNLGYVCKKRANRRSKEEYIYYINPFFSTTAGFTMIENAVVDKMLKELTNGEMKLYSYLCFMISSSGNGCWASQKYLAKKIDKRRNSISEMTDNLQVKKFINKKIEEKDGIMHSTYKLNF